MPQVPRIGRTEPSAAAVRPLAPLPVVVTLIWHDGVTDETDADAVAWTQGEVEIEWTTPWGDTPTRLGQGQPGTTPALKNHPGRRLVPPRCPRPSTSDRERPCPCSNGRPGQRRAVTESRTSPALSRRLGR
jgi:hypothetical protein